MNKINKHGCATCMFKNSFVWILRFELCVWIVCMNCVYEFERYSSKKCIWLKQDWNQFSIHYEYIQFNEGRYFHVKSYVPGPFYPSCKISTYFIIERDCVVVISIFIWSIMWKISSFLILTSFKFWQFFEFI